MTERRIYIGPTLPRWGLRFGMVFSEGLTPFAASAVEKCADIEGLIVPVSKTTESRAAAARKGTAVNTRIAAVLAAYGQEA